MILSPINTNQHHPDLLCRQEPEKFRSDLMDQCSKHDTPPAIRLLTNQTGHALAIEIKSQVQRVLTVWRLTRPALQTRLIHTH